LNLRHCNQPLRNDIIYTLDLESGTTHVFPDVGAAFAFGDVRCDPAAATCASSPMQK